MVVATVMKKPTSCQDLIPLNNCDGYDTCLAPRRYSDAVSSLRYAPISIILSSLAMVCKRTLLYQTSLSTDICVSNIVVVLTAVAYFVVPPCKRICSTSNYR